MAAAALVLLCSAFLLWWGVAQQHPNVYAGISADLLLTAPIAAYLITRGRINKLYLVLILLAGSLIGFAMLPTDGRQVFDAIRFILIPLVELVVMVRTVMFFRKLMRNASDTADRYTAIQQSAVRAFDHPRIGRLFGSEVAMFYYALAAWRTRPLHVGEFSYYRKSGSLALLWAIVMILLVETFALHVLLERWSTLAAWLLTAGSIYTIILLIGHINAVRHRPHRVTENTLTLKLGLFGKADIPLADIESIDGTNRLPADKTLRIGRFQPLGELESHNTVLYLRRPVTVEFLYGIHKTYDALLLQLDDRDGFIASLNK